MKKPKISLLVAVTCIFVALLLGFFLGRNFFRGEVIVSNPAYIPPETITIAENSSISASTEHSTVNINTAGLYELASLPGIGESLAQRIIDYRTVNGPFSAPEELLNINGIGSTKLEAILDHITTGG